jgi:hypothetical protein
MTKERILSIEAYEGPKLGEAQGRGWVYTYEGYLITTDRQRILLGISAEQSCCEQSGYLMTNDNLKEFEGADLLAIKHTDNALKTIQIPCDMVELLNDRDTSTMFITLETDRGTLQFVAYNNHNGYYSHTALVQSQQFTDEQSL